MKDHEIYTKDTKGFPLREGSSCPHDPIMMEGWPIGMYHCPECETMVVACAAHPSDDFMRENGEEPFRDKMMRRLEELKTERNPSQKPAPGFNG